MNEEYLRGGGGPGQNPEIPFLLACAVSYFQGDLPVEYFEPACQLNWDRVYTLAARHGLLSIVYWSLSRIDSTAVPPQVLNEFRREFEKNASDNLSLTAELCRVLAACRAQQLSIAVYKGPALSVLAYGNLLLRPFCDLDLLMHRNDRKRCHEVLAGLGYHRQFHSDHENNEYAHSYVKHEGDGAIVIEAHWAITPRHFALPDQTRGLWDRLVEVSLGDREKEEYRVATPGLEDQLLILSWHGYKHRWSRLEWVACIAGLLYQSENKKETKRDVEWQQLLKQAKTSGCLRILYLGLLLAHQLFEAPLPPEVLTAARADAGAIALCEALKPDLLSDSVELETPVSETSGTMRFFHLSSRERWRDKLRYCWRLLRTPSQIDWRSVGIHIGKKAV